MKREKLRNIILAIGILLICLSAFSFFYKGRDSARPLHYGVIIDKKEVIGGSSHKSQLHYEMRKRFTIKWDVGITTDLFPTQSDYYSLNVGDRVGYRILLTEEEKGNDNGWFIVIFLGFIVGLCFFVAGIVPFD